MERISSLALAAMAIDALQPGQKGYIDYKNRPGYNWKTINHSKVLLNGKGRVVAGATGKFKGRTWGAKWKGIGTKRSYTKKPAAPASNSPLSQAAQAAPAPASTPSKPQYTAAGIAAAQAKANQMANQGNSYNARAVGYNVDVLMNRGDSFEDAVAKIEDLFNNPSVWGYRFDRQKAEQYLQELKDIASGKTAAAAPASAPAPAPASTSHKMATGINKVAQKNYKPVDYSNRGIGSANAFKQESSSQGYRGAPRMVATKAEFDAAVKASGVYGVRTYRDNSKATLNQWRNDLYGKSGGDDWYTDCGGGARYGQGMYVAIASGSKPGTVPTNVKKQNAYDDSDGYGYGRYKHQESITIDPSAKIARGHYMDIDRDIRQEWKKTYISNHPGATMRDATQAMTDHSSDIGVLAAELGYDAILAEDAGWSCDYLNILNRTKCIILDGGYQP